MLPRLSMFRIHRFLSNTLRSTHRREAECFSDCPGAGYTVLYCILCILCNVGRPHAALTAQLQDTLIFFECSAVYAL